MDFRKILVAVNGTDIDEEAIQLACSLARKSRGKIYVTYVIEMDRTLPIDAEVDTEMKKAEAALDSAESCAEKCDYEISTDLLQARAIGPALVNECTERDVDLLIIGMNYKTRFGEFSLGDVAPHVLKNAPCRVMLLRERLSSGLAGSSSTTA